MEDSKNACFFYLTLIGFKSILLNNIYMKNCWDYNIQTCNLFVNKITEEMGGGKAILNQGKDSRWKIKPIGTNEENQKCIDFRVTNTFQQRANLQIWNP